MNSKASNLEFHVDIDKAIDQFSNMSKCLDRKWNIHYDQQCDKNCGECEYMYGSGNSGQIKNLFENVQEWLEELKLLRVAIKHIQWERNLAIQQLEELGGHFKEKPELIYQRIYNKAIDDCIKIAEETVWKDSEMLVEYFKELKE